MTEASDRTYTLDSERLEHAIDVLRRARTSFGLTRRERITYRALLISGDVAIVSYWVMLLLQWTVVRSPSEEPTDLTAIVFLLGASIFGMSILVGTVALLLNLPVFLKTWRERAELKSLGLGTLSTSLWRERRRHRWLQRIRGILLLISGVSFVLLAVALGAQLFTEKSSAGVAFGTALGALVGLTLLAARYLRNRREQIDLAANAERLREALGELRRRAGGAAISIPAETLEQVARIESAQIARERRTAILEGAGSAQSGYAVLFLREATEQRSALDVQGRIELEDLIERLSTRTAHVEPGARGVDALERARTASAAVEIEYAIDEPRREIRVAAVRRIAGDADRHPVSGGDEHG